MSTTALADATGIGPLQLEKFEKGSSRANASDLYGLARALEVSVSFFFSEGVRRRSREAPDNNLDAELIGKSELDHETVELLRIYGETKDPKLRGVLQDLVRLIREN